MRESQSRHMLALRRLAREAEHEAAKAAGSVPPATLTATRCGGEEPWFPRSARSLLKRAREAGWWASPTRAVGPRIGGMGTVLEERCATLCVAVAKTDQRLVWEWRYSNGKWTLESVQDMRTGLLLNDSTGKARLT